MLLTRTILPLTLAPGCEELVRSWPPAKVGAFELYPRSESAQTLEPSVAALLATRVVELDDEVQQDRMLLLRLVPGPQRGVHRCWNRDTPSLTLVNIGVALTTRHVGALWLEWESLDVESVGWVGQCLTGLNRGFDGDLKSVLCTTRGGHNSTMLQLMGLGDPAERPVREPDEPSDAPTHDLVERKLGKVVAGVVQLLNQAFAERQDELREQAKEAGAHASGAMRLPALATVQRGEHAFHFTSARVDDGPPTDAQLWRVCRAMPPEVLPPAVWSSVIMEHERSNRRLLVSREGVVRVSWPEQGEDAGREIENGVKKFGQRHFYLFLIAFLERLALDHYSADAQQATAAVSVLLTPAVGERRTAAAAYERAEEAAAGVQAVAASLVRTSLLLVAADAGGRFEGANLFRMVRQVHRNDELLAEHRAQLTDLLRIVESLNQKARLLADHEAQQADRDAQKADREYQQARTAADAAAAARDRHFQTSVSVLGMFVAIVTVVTGIYGMNSWDKYQHAMSAGAVVLCLVIVAIFIFRRPGRNQHPM